MALSASFGPATCDYSVDRSFPCIARRQIVEGPRAAYPTASSFPAELAFPAVTLDKL